jgi:hypothetical protein
MGRGAAGRLVVLAPLAEGAATVMAMDAKGCDEGRGPGGQAGTPVAKGPLAPSVDAPGAAGDQLGAGDELACFEGLFDGGLIGLAGGLEGEPLGGQGVFVGDLDGLALVGAELVIREGEPGGGGLQPGEHQDKGVLQGIGPAGIGAGQLREPLGLLLAVGGLAAQVLDHPAGGNRCAEAFRYGLGGEGLLVAFVREQGSLQLSEGIGSAVVGFQLLSKLADGGGELLGLDAQLPERAGVARRTLRCDALQGAGWAGGLRERWGERSDGGGENGHGDV